MLEEYERDLAIDPLSLDEDFLVQPGLYMKYSVMAADADKCKNQAKEKLDVVKAELDRAIRKEPSQFGLEKITESVVASTIILQPEYKEASDELIEASYQYSILQAAVRAFDHRKSALENEVKLWLGTYFAGPKEPRDIPGGKRIIDVARDKVSSRARNEMNIRGQEQPTEEKAQGDFSLTSESPRRRKM